MARRSAFAEVLNEKLRALESSDADRLTSTRARRAIPPDPFLFTAPYHSYNAARYPVRPPECDAAPRRSLALPEQDALAALNHFGAGLSTDFTSSELRSAFRVLARRYHPDRHHATGGSEQTLLARIFCEIVEHHRQLAAVASY